MKTIPTTIVLLLIGFSAVELATGQEREPERAWRRLPLIADGRVAPDWTQIGGGRFAVEDGSLRTECDDAGMGMLLYAKEKFGNCQIRVVFKCKDARANSGVFIRIDDGVMKLRGEKPDAIARDKEGRLTARSLERLQEASEREQGGWYPVHRGFEVQICETGDEYHRTGAIYSLAKAAPLPKLAGDGWRTMIITLNESRVQVAVDGQQVTTFDSDAKDLPKRQKWFEPKREPKRPTAGYIGLQTHDPGDVVWFKEVSVRAKTGTSRVNSNGPWPDLATGAPAPPVDTDHDGMPDAWETAHGLDPNNASDGAAFATNGYTVRHGGVMKWVPNVRVLPVVALLSMTALLHSVACAQPSRSQDGIAYIETHIHLKADYQERGRVVWDFDAAAREAIRSMIELRIDKCLLMPPPFAPQNPTSYDYRKLKEVCDKYPERFAFLGGGSLNPLIQQAVKDCTTDDIRKAGVSLAHWCMTPSGLTIDANSPTQSG